MGIMNIDKNQIPLKAYLRADPNSQHYVFDDQSELVTSEMFWGTPSSPGLYLDYSHINDRNIQISKGIAGNASLQTLKNSDCDKWIDTNIIKAQSTKLFVIQGYAGCGKTTFINHVLNKWIKRDIDHVHIDIGRRWSYSQEPYMFFSESLNAFDNLIDSIIKASKTRNKVWKKFIELGSDILIDQFDSGIRSVVLLLDKIKEGTIRKGTEWKYLRNNIHQRLAADYGESGSPVWSNYGQTQIIISLLILMKCAQYCCDEHSRGSKYNLSFVFDNLDVITNPAIPAENVVLLWGVIHNYIIYKAKYTALTHKDLPDFLVVITVRKVLLSHIVSHLPDLEMVAGYDSNCVYVCDISHLYLSRKIIAHRISYWLDHINSNEVLQKLHRLNEIVTIQEEVGDALEKEYKQGDDYVPRETINLDAFVNYNYRAFTNALAAILDDPKYSDIIYHDFASKSSSKPWQKVASIVFLLSLLYTDERVWNAMGFGCKSFDLVDYPTTLNRLILNMLYAARRGHSLYENSGSRGDISTNSFVNLNDIIQPLEKVKFMSVETILTDYQLHNLYADTSVNMKDLILDRLADMCARNPRFSNTSAYGYDAENDELWRRPIYFTGKVKLFHTATSHAELKAEFQKLLKSQQANEVVFSITDEGFILIDDIVANFEFYSARYSDPSFIKPLHQATSVDEIDKLVRPVYNAVRKCCSKNIFFMTQYMNSYNISKDEYLRLPFHPRTKPRFDKKAKPTKKLIKTSFRPQLHIVRVIYAHIGYFDNIKACIAKSKKPESLKMCKCLTNWIEAYLNLYRTNLYARLNKSICDADNRVYVSLNNMLISQKKQYEASAKGKNVRIATRKTMFS